LFANQLISFLNNALESSAFLLNAANPLVQHTFVRFTKTQARLALEENALMIFAVRSSVETSSTYVPLPRLSERWLVTLVTKQLAVNQPVILSLASKVMRNQWRTCSHASSATMMFAARRWFAVIIVVLRAGIQKRACQIFGALPALAQTQTAVPRTLALTTFALQDRKIWTAHNLVLSRCARIRNAARISLVMARTTLALLLSSDNLPSLDVLPVRATTMNVADQSALQISALLIMADA